MKAYAFLPLLALALPALAQDPATDALPAGLPGLYHTRGSQYSNGLLEIDESGRVSVEDRDAKWNPVPAIRTKLSPVGTIRPAPEAGPGLLAFISDKTDADGQPLRFVLAFDSDRFAIHALRYDKEHARPWMAEFAQTGLFYEPRKDLIRLDKDLATLWCDTMYRFEPSDGGGVEELVYSLWDEVGNLTPQQRRDLDEILARKIRALSWCREAMHLDDNPEAPLRNPYDGKPDPILDVSPDLRPAITRLPPAPNTATNASGAKWRPTPDQIGRFRFEDNGTFVVAAVDAEGRVRLDENEPVDPPLRLQTATIRGRDLFVVEMDDIPDTGRHWTLALDFDAEKRAWIVVGEGETIADIIPGKPGYRTATFHREDHPAEETHAESAEKDSHAEAAEGAKSTNEVFDEVVGCVLDAVDKGQEPNLRLPPADEWGNPFSVTNGADFVKVGSFGADGKKSEDDFLLTIHWGEGFANVRRVSFDEELQCPSEEMDFYDW